MLKVVFLVATLIALLTACPPTPQPSNSPVFVGKILGSDALIALVINPEGVVVYTCGGSSTWETHTAWFYPVFETALGASGLIPKTSAKGLELDGSFGEQSASGTLQLENGTQLAWSASRANPNTGAGLYAYTEEGNLGGLIVDNDGASAGTFALGTADGTRINSPITPVSPPTGSSTTVVGTTPLFPSLKLVKVVAIPALTIPRISPQIVVVLHGVTSVGDQAVTGKSLEDNTDKDLTAVNGTRILKPHPGTRLHARSYWTAPFVAGLLGGQPNSSLLTLGTATPIGGNEFLSATKAQDITTTNGFVAPPPADCNLDDFISTQPEISGTLGTFTPPRRVVLLTHRDGKLSFVQQFKDATEQIFKCVQLYERRYRIQPNLVFVGHSGGGLVTRAILSSPSRSSLQSVFPEIANAAFNIWETSDGIRSKMNYLRDRTQYAVTLATPHQGSFFADWGLEARQKAANIRAWLVNGGIPENAITFNLDAADVLMVQQIASGMAFGAISGVLETAAQTVLRLRNDLIAGFDRIVAEQYDDNPVTAQLITPTWRTLNQTALAPRLARRTANSPIPGAANRLIPIYPVGGRSAGSDVFNSLDPKRILENMNNLSNRQMTERAKFWVAGLTFSDQITRRFGLLPNPAVGQESRLDRVKATAWLAENTRLVSANSISLDATFKAVWVASGGSTAAALLNALSNSTRIPLNQAQIDLPVYLLRDWNMQSTSLTFRIPALVCRSAANAVLSTIRLLDYPYLLDAMLQNHRTMDLAIEAYLTLDFNALTANLEARGGTLASAALQLTTDFAAALLRPDIAAIATCTIPSNWKFEAVNSSASVLLPTQTNSPTSDGLVDHDGFVSYDSAMGMTLGQNIQEFFDHTRLDFNGTPGSWYRQYDSALEPFNHEIQRFETAAWVNESILSRNPGPVPAVAGNLSVFP
jgi:hypothetical protein